MVPGFIFDTIKRKCMRLYSDLRKAILAAMFAMAITAGMAQVSGQELLSTDQAVSIGKLENGLTYYIRNNKKPEQKVELRLVVNVGSIVEDDNQLGLAHMAEHMAFNGTTHFKKNEIVSFLQDIGVGFGNDLNAYTNFDETVYVLPIPTDKPGNLEKGFQVLEDWAHNVTYLDEDINSERPIILEESRLGKGAQDRMYRQIYPALFAGSKYARRITIGSDSIIRTFPPNLIRKFYKDWYRPNLMAVIVVGDVQPDSALAMIKKHFAALVNPVPERARVFEAVPSYPSSEGLVVTDKEATSYSVYLNYSASAAHQEKTVSDYRSLLIRQLFTSLLNQRLQEMTQQSNPPFVAAGSYYGEFIRGYEKFRAYAAVGNGDIRLATQALVQEVERARRFGFTAAELERAKKNNLSSMERLYNNRDKTESESYVDEYVQHFLTGEPIPGIAREYALYQAEIPGISLGEVNNVARLLTADTNRLVYVTGPVTPDASKLPAGKELLALVQSAERSEIKPYEEKLVQSNLLPVKPVPGRIISRKADAAMGVTEFQLSNGVTVTVKPTDFKNDQILLGASRSGGKNLFGVADHINAEFTIPLISAMGIGEFSPTDLRKVLAGKSVNLAPQMTEVSEGFKGSSVRKDLETLFQLVYLYATRPREDSVLFQSFVQRNKSQFAALSANPQNAFIDTVLRVMYQDNPLMPLSVPKPAYFDQLNLARIVAMYKERLCDASGMHFVLVGSFSIDSLVPFIETYLASLPSSGKKIVTKDNGLRPVSGQKKIVVHKGREPKSLILSFYTGETPYSQDLALKAQAISEILNIRIIEELREKIQGIYGGGLYAEVEKLPYPNYSFVLQLPCGPEKVDTLLKSANQEIELLKKNGPDLSYLNKVKQQWLEAYKADIKENETWLTELLDWKSGKSNPKYFLQYEEMVKQLNPASIQAAAKLLLDGRNVFTAILMPESAL